MKTFLILIMLLTFGCAGVSTPAPLNISVNEVENAEVLYAFPLTSTHIQAFSKCRGTTVAFITYILNSVIIRYCYLDQGRLMGFKIDVDVYDSTHEKVYIVDHISKDIAEGIVRALNRVNSGLEPYDLEESDPSRI